VDLFGMYGSRSDEDEPDEDAGLRALGVPEAVKKPSARPEPEPEPEPVRAEVTHPIPRLTEDGRPSAEHPSLDNLRPATAEQVAAYVEHLGTVMDDSMLLRPYVRTGGRTHADADLPIEALVMGVPSIDHTRMAAEHRQVHAICTEPRSVAEIAAYSRLPIGSARVIIGDMLGLGLLVLCSTEVTAESPSMELMARVRQGLRNL
jgi:uncharacterized protein DUF742